MQRYLPVLKVTHKNGTHNGDVKLSEARDKAFTFDELIELSIDWFASNVDDIDTVNFFIKCIDYTNPAMALDPENKKISFTDPKNDDKYLFVVEEEYVITEAYYQYDYDDIKKNYKIFDIDPSTVDPDKVDDLIKSSTVPEIEPVPADPIPVEENPLNCTECDKLSSTWITDDSVDATPPKYVVKPYKTIDDYIVKIRKAETQRIEEERKHLHKAFATNKAVQDSIETYQKIVQDYFDSHPSFDDLVEFAGAIGEIEKNLYGDDKADAGTQLSS